MKKQIYLSIIVPCYNGSQVIEKAIESVKMQERNDIEMIIVNDGSTDNTEEVCKKYDDCGFIRYYKTENMGAGHARNFGISKANGIWISFLDSDDLYMEDSMNRVIPALKEYEKKGIEVVYTPRTKGDMQLNNSSVTEAEEIDESSHMPELEFVNCLYLKAFLDNKNIRFFEYKEQDIETAFRYRVFSNSPKVVTDNSLPFYFQRDNPHSNTHTWREDVLHRIKAKVYLELLENNATKKNDTWLYGIVLREAAKYYLNCVKYGCADKEALKQVNSTYKKAKKLSSGIVYNKKTVKFTILSMALRVLGNTIGRRCKVKI